MNARLERILTKLAKQYAPYLLEQGYDTTRIQQLTRALAKHGILVMIGDIVAAEREAHLRPWVNAYADFYKVLTQRLFPSYTKIEVLDADSQTPPIVVLIGQVRPVINAIAGWIVPYIAIRQHDRMISEVEIMGLMTLLLEDLEAADLPRADFNQLKTQGVEIIHRLLQMPVQQVWITDFDRPIFVKMPGLAKPQTVTVEKKTPPPQPPTLPALPKLEDDLSTVDTPSEQLFLPIVPGGKDARKRANPFLPPEHRG
jgi:hypothetical protein